MRRLAGDGYASSEIHVTHLHKEIIIFATRTREALSEMGPKDSVRTRPLCRSELASQENSVHHFAELIMAPERSDSKTQATIEHADPWNPAESKHSPLSLDHATCEGTELKKKKRTFSGTMRANTSEGQCTKHICYLFWRKELMSKGRTSECTLLQPAKQRSSFGTPAGRSLECHAIYPTREWQGQFFFFFAKPWHGPAARNE